jgi:ribonuclease-3
MVESEDAVAGLGECEVLLGIRFRERELLRTALTHSSAKSPGTPCNERLEFLGDSVLGLVIAEQLFRNHPLFSEGDLTQVKSVVVSSKTLAELGSDLGIERFIHLGKGIRRGPGVPQSLVAGVVESVIGAVFLDQGLEEARRLVLRWLAAPIDAVLDDRYRSNYKSILQNYTQRALGVTPTYRVVTERGPAHGKVFEVEAVVGRRAFSHGTGRSKKDAEQVAAEAALAVLLAEAEGGLPVPWASAVLPVPWAGFSAAPGDPEREGASGEAGAPGACGGRALPPAGGDPVPGGPGA